MTRLYTKRGTPFWDRFKRTESGCWEWQAGRVKNYGTLRVDGAFVYAHRHAWTLTHGAIPDGYFVCHACDNPPCGNPEHLFLGTRQDNVDDMVAKGRQARQSGERHAQTRISDNTVVALRALRSSGVEHHVLGWIFGISSSYACRLATGDRR